MGNSWPVRQSHPSLQLRELSALVRAYHELDPPEPGRASPSRGNLVDSAPLSLDGHLVLAARELPPSAQPLLPRSSDPEPPSPFHLDYPSSSGNLQGQAGPSAGVYAEPAKPRIAPILTTSPSNSLPATPTIQPLQSTAVATQYRANNTPSETPSKAISLVLTSSPRRGASVENPTGGSLGFPVKPGSAVDPAPLSATPQMHSASQM